MARHFVFPVEIMCFVTALHGNAAVKSVKGEKTRLKLPGKGRKTG